MRITDILREASRELGIAGVVSPQLDARLLLQHAANLDAETIAADPLLALESSAVDRFRLLLQRRMQREPVSRILGQREFWSIDFDIGPGVLDPRPDSETLVEAVLNSGYDADQPLTILDLGTGSSCLLCAVLSEFPAAMGIGVDISGDALHVAAGNLGRHGLTERSCLVLGNWADPIAERCIDVVIANPPYIPSGEIDDLAPEVERYEPRLALDGGEDGLQAYRGLLAELPRIMRDNGRVFLEIGAGQSDSVAFLLEESGATGVEGLRDLGRHVRCLSAVYGAKK